MKTTYVGLRHDGALYVYAARGKRIDPLPPRLDLRSHSPAGFEAGYGGSGPAQLALAILAHATQDDALTCRIYQNFKWQVIAKLSRRNWRLPQADVLAWVATFDKCMMDAADVVSKVEADWNKIDPGEIVNIMEDQYGQETHPDGE